MESWHIGPGNLVRHIKLTHKFSITGNVSHFDVLNRDYDGCLLWFCMGLVIPWKCEESSSLLMDQWQQCKTFQSSAISATVVFMC